MKTIQTANGMLVFGILALTAASASAQLYRWVDDDGRQVVSDTPPPAKYKAQLIKKPTAKGSSGEVSAADGRKDVPKESATNDPVQPTAPHMPDQRTCDQAKQGILALESEMPLTMTNTKGERVRMDEKTRAQETSRLRDLLKNCKP